MKYWGLSYTVDDVLSKMLQLLNLLVAVPLVGFIGRLKVIKDPESNNKSPSPCICFMMIKEPEAVSTSK